MIDLPATGNPALDTALIWGTVIITAAGVSTALWRLVRGTLHFARRVEHFFDAWYGEEERPGVPARPGMMERVSAMEAGFQGFSERLRRMEHELYPNDGGSLRDAIDLANHRLARLLPGGDGQDPQRAPNGDSTGAS